MTRHASAETLARFRGGSLRRGATRRVRAHLDACARCTATCNALGEIPALLAATEAPPIPAHLAARIETALATESAHRAAGSPSVSPARAGRSGSARRRHSQPGRPLHAARRRGRLPAPARPAIAAAAIVVVVGGGLFAVTQLGGSAGSSSSSAGSAVSAPASGGGTGHGPASGLVRPGAKASAALEPLVRYQAGGQSATIRPVQTATNYQPARLSEQVAATLAQVSRGPAVSPNVGLPHTGQRAGSSQLAQLSGCLSRVAGDQPVRVVDLAQFRGSAATIIVTRATSSRAAQVWVVGPGCSRSASDMLDHQQLPG